MVLRDPSLGDVLPRIDSLPWNGLKTAIEKPETGFRLPAPTCTATAVYDLMRQCWGYLPLDRPRFPEIVVTLRGITHDLMSKNI